MLLKEEYPSSQPSSPIFLGGLIPILLEELDSTILDLDQLKKKDNNHPLLEK